MASAATQFVAGDSFKQVAVSTASNSHAAQQYGQCTSGVFSCDY